ncbi:MAG: LysE family translocator [Afipia sp.]|nr:LysE family translocator [Afipia sp.]
MGRSDVRHLSSVAGGRHGESFPAGKGVVNRSDAQFTVNPLLKFALTVFLLELTPGPNMAYLAALSLARGCVAGFIATAGIALGLATHAVLVALGAGAVIQNYPALYESLRWAGIAYLLLLAWEGWQPMPEILSKGALVPDVARSIFWRGFLSNIFNPKSILFFLSVVPSFIDAASTQAVALQLATLGTIAVAVASIVHSGTVIAADQSGRWIADNRMRGLIRRTLSAILALMAVWLAWAAIAG